MKNIFEKSIADEFVSRINQLKPESQPLWGKMNVAQMLAHCNVTYELVYEHKHKKPNVLMKFILKTFVKKVVVSETPYKRNNPTAPYFIIKDEKKFDLERKRLIDHIIKTQELGEAHFDKKESHSFGILSVSEWNNMFYKHLDHHLAQFGV
ncbi:DUF1569 domain-containing protein [Pedobacter sp. P351]|uniref:DUF1569 domain-containing protein n=1 Tax=Pedobacter superstes TaxID=3133441 RepID=UPI003099EE02